MKMLNAFTAAVVMMCCFCSTFIPQAHAAAKSQKSKFVTVTVSGSGETHEKARENAKKNALIHVVGEAIKSNTRILENGDEAKVTAEFISASAGLISDYKELAHKRTGSVFTVKAAVTVYQEKMLETVVFGTNNPGSVNVSVGSDIEETRENMTRYITSYMLDYCRIWNLQTREIIPEYDKHGKPVLYVNFYWGTTPAKYKMYLARLSDAVKRVNGECAKYNYKHTRTHANISIVQNPDSHKPTTLHFWISKKYMEPQKVFSGIWKKYGYKLTFELLDANGNVIKTVYRGCGHLYSYSQNPGPASNGTNPLTLHPLRGNGKKTAYRRKFHLKVDEFADAAEMLKVKKVRARIDIVIMSREPLIRFRQYWKDCGWEWYDR